MPYTARTVRTINVDIQEDGVPGGAPPGGGEWSIEAVGFEADFTCDGTGDATPVVPTLGDIYDDREYSIVFTPEDGYVTPTASNITASATPQTFTGDYVSHPAGTNIQVTLLNSAPQAIIWQMTGPADYSHDGVGDELLTSLAPGDYTIRWGWHHDWRIPGLGLLFQETKAVTSGNTTDFDGNYQSRSLPAKDKLPIGSNVPSDEYWLGSLGLSDAARGRSTWWEGDPILDADGWPTSLPGGWAYSWITMVDQGNGGGIQTFHAFWEGNGTMSIFQDTEQGGSPLWNHVCTDAAGQVGVTFTTDIFTGTDYKDNGGWWGTLRIEATSSTPGEHLRNIEIVHEDCLGPSGEKFYRSVDPANSTMMNKPFREFAKSCPTLRFLIHNENTNDRYGDEGDFWSGIGRQWDEYTEGGQGRPLRLRVQDRIDVCNATDSDMWVTQSTWVDDVTAQLHHSAYEAPYTGQVGGGLRNDRMIYLEHSNEVWNFAFWQAQYCQYWSWYHVGSGVDPTETPFPDRPGGVDVPATLGFEDFDPDERGGADWYWMKRWSSYRTWQLHELYKINPNFAAKVPSIYASIDDRVRLVQGAHGSSDEGNYIHFRKGDGPQFDLVQFAPGDNYVDHVYGMATAPYTWIGAYGAWPPAAEDYETAANAYFDEWISYNETGLRGEMDVQGGICADVGVKYIAYEGTQHAEGADADSAKDWVKYLNYHPRMYEMLYKYFDEWKASGGKEFMVYLSPMTWNDYDIYYWGMFPTFNFPENLAYRYHCHIDWQEDNQFP